MQFWFIVALFCSIALFHGNCNVEAVSSSCQEVYMKYDCKINKAYPLSVGCDNLAYVYCHLTELGACGGGGWTLVMKINPSTVPYIFHYDSPMWTNKLEYNPRGGLTGFDYQDTKLPTYWDTPFSKICLAMKIGDDPVNYLLINQSADSLYSLIADGQYRNTSLGRDAWKTLINPQASLQSNCTKEGFNVVGNSTIHSKARIGVIASNQDDCASYDSRIGFGTGGSPDDSNTCGNAAEATADNGAVNIKAMGYIFVQ